MRQVCLTDEAAEEGDILDKAFPQKALKGARARTATLGLKALKSRSACQAWSTDRHVMELTKSIVLRIQIAEKGAVLNVRAQTQAQHSQSMWDRSES
eukprot:s166_g10.t1